ncbi:hypothetical protein SUGI_0059580 [Cryptomeria japonica]|nr:hypothetical protein SUGI_0059580 [Cryptomeria japonica]
MLCPEISPHAGTTTLKLWSHAGRLPDCSSPLIIISYIGAREAAISIVFLLKFNTISYSLRVGKQFQDQQGREISSHGRLAHCGRFLSWAAVYREKQKTQLRARSKSRGGV